jgi:hypothetical protein
MPGRVPTPLISRAVHTGRMADASVLGSGNTAPELCPGTGDREADDKACRGEKGVVTMTAEPAIQDRATEEGWVPVRAGVAGARPASDRRRRYAESGVTTVRCAVLPPDRPGADRTAGVGRVGVWV